MKSLIARLTGKIPQLDVKHLDVTVYSRPGCSCCVTALETLSQYQRRYGFALRDVPIDPHPELVEKYGLSIPVVMVDGKVRFKGQVNPALFERLLHAESRGA